MRITTMPILVEILFFILGLAFTLFGYFIFFKKNYSLINVFDVDLKAGKKDESYARKVGIIEFVLGIVILVADIFVVVLV